MPRKNKNIRILIIEGNRLLCEGITSILNTQSGMLVVATIESGNNIAQRIIHYKPHVVLLDAGLKNLKELSVVEVIKQKSPEVKVIGMGFMPSQKEIVEFVEAGASGFILKDATTKEYIVTIQSVAQGVQVIPPSMTGSLFSYVAEQALKNGKRKITSTVRMTQREREIIALIADGKSNKEIAKQLYIATHTVKSHVHNIMEKLALHSRLQIAKFNQDENL